MNYSAVETGKRIRKLRKERGLTQEQLASKFELTDRHIRNIETGNRNASLDFLAAISDMFDVSLDYLIVGKPTQIEMKRELQTLLESISVMVEKL